MEACNTYSNLFQNFRICGTQPLTIGRTPDNDIAYCLACVSGSHAALYPEGNGMWRLEDRSSKNGIYVNGIRTQMQRLRLSSWQTCCRSSKIVQKMLSDDSEMSFYLPSSILHFPPADENHPRKSRVVFFILPTFSPMSRGQLLNPLQWERRERHRLHGDGHQLHRVIVRRCAVRVQYTAPAGTTGRPHTLQVKLSSQACVL